MAFLGLKKFNVGSVVTAGIALFAAKSFMKKKNFLLLLTANINTVMEQVESFKDLGKHLGAIFHRPHGKPNFGALFGKSNDTRDFTFDNPYPVLAGGFGITLNGKMLDADRLMYVTNMEIEQGAEGGYLHVTLPKRLPFEQMEKVQLLFKGMLISLKSIELEYSQFIKIENK